VKGISSILTLMVTALVLMIGALGAVTTVLNTLDDSTSSVASVGCKEAIRNACGLSDSGSDTGTVSVPPVCSSDVGNDDVEAWCSEY